MIEKNKKRLILVELNEINFDVVKNYIQQNIALPGFKKIIDDGIQVTNAEKEYDNLEPWIQWPSVHFGKKFHEHKIFRLGDAVNYHEKQIFEKVEEKGFKVGAISPMNAKNDLKQPSYFIPDPWTKTPSDKSFLSKSVTDAIVQAVNDNSQSKLTIKTIFNLAVSFFALVNPKKYIHMFIYAIQAVGKPWRKALFLDKLLYEIHKTLFYRKNPQFSTIFLNAGAHIQHHYFFNSSGLKNINLKNPDWYINDNDDPFLEMLLVYDSMISDLLEIDDAEIIIATGLSQKPYEKLKFYYRLKDHAKFLERIGITFREVMPRMTRDFLISFESSKDAKIAEDKLSNIYVDDGQKLFNQIDNRGKEIFVVMTYPNEIFKHSYIMINDEKLLLNEHVVFVAIKNGEHQNKGYAYYTNGLKKFVPPSNSHVSEIHDVVMKFFINILPQ